MRYLYTNTRACDIRSSTTVYPHRDLRMSRKIPPNKMTKLRPRRPSDSRGILIFCSFRTKEFIIKFQHQRHTILWEGTNPIPAYLRRRILINMVLFPFQLPDVRRCYDTHYFIFKMCSSPIIIYFMSLLLLVTYASRLYRWRNYVYQTP